MRKRLLTSLAAGVFTVLQGVTFAPPAAATTACDPEKLAEKYPGLVGRTVLVGVDPQTPPYVMRDSEDLEKLVGIDADLARAAFECAGVSYEFLPGAWSGLLPATTSGQIDVIWDNLYYNPDRGRTFDFVIFMEAGTGALTQAGNPKGINSAEEMCGAIAAVTLGGFEESIVSGADVACKAAGEPGVEMLSFQDVAAGVRLIDNSRADILMWDAGLIDTMVGNNPEKYSRAFMTLSGIKIGPAVRKDDGELLQAIFDGLTALKADGRMTRIFETYNVDPASQVDVFIGRED